MKQWCPSILWFLILYNPRKDGLAHCFMIKGCLRLHSPFTLIPKFYLPLKTPSANPQNWFGHCHPRVSGTVHTYFCRSCPKICICNSLINPREMFYNMQMAFSCTLKPRKTPRAHHVRLQVLAKRDYEVSKCSLEMPGLDYFWRKVGSGRR